MEFDVIPEFPEKRVRRPRRRPMAGGQPRASAPQQWGYSTLECNSRESDLIYRGRNGASTTARVALTEGRVRVSGPGALFRSLTATLSPDGGKGMSCGSRFLPVRITVAAAPVISRGAGRRRSAAPQHI